MACREFHELPHLPDRTQIKLIMSNHFVCTIGSGRIPVEFLAQPFPWYVRREEGEEGDGEKKGKKDRLHVYSSERLKEKGLPKGTVQVNSLEEFLAKAQWTS